MAIIELGIWRNAKREAEQKRFNEWKTRVEEEANYLQQAEVRDAFEACAKRLRRDHEDVTLRIIKPAYHKDNPRIELTWNYQQYRGESGRPSWKCDSIGARVERNSKTQEIVGIGLFEDTLNTYNFDTSAPVMNELIAKLDHGIKNPFRRSQRGVNHPSLAKRIVAAFS